MTSVVIAFRNDRFIWRTISELLYFVGKDSTRLEVIVVDDASDEPIKQTMIQLYPRIKVIRNEVQRGVGFSFDRGVSEAKGENIVLMGSDVIVKNVNWLDIVENYCTNYRQSLGSSVCLSLDPDHLDINNPADDVKRYGATIIPLSTSEDLPSDSPLLDRDQFYVGAFDAKWLKKEPQENISEIPCIYGAMYVTTKSWYQHINGWDSDFTRKLSGHKAWGSLEPWISLKNYLYGGTCHVIKELESGHVFHKFGEEGSPHGRTDYFWYNKMFIAYTCMEQEEADRLVKKIYSLRVKYELYTRPFNLGRKLLKQNWDYVMQIRERNKREMVHDMDWLLSKFSITKKW